MAECSKVASVSELPECESVNPDSYLIVQNGDSTCKVKISNLTLGSENVDFYPELIEILNKLNELMARVDPNVDKWNDTSQLVNNSKGAWDIVNDSQAGNNALKQRLDTGTPNWDKAYTDTNGKADQWDATTSLVNEYADKWTNTHDIVVGSQENWDKAYGITIDGTQAISEALELITTSPWFTDYNFGTQPTAAHVWQVYSEHQTYSNDWNSVFNTVRAFSGDW